MDETGHIVTYVGFAWEAEHERLVVTKVPNDYPSAPEGYEYFRELIAAHPFLL